MNADRPLYRVYLADGNYVDIPWKLHVEFDNMLQQHFGVAEESNKSTMQVNWKYR